MAAKGRAKGGGPNRDTPGVNIEMSGSSFLVLVLVWGLIAIWPIKAAQATAEEDQNARVIVNRGAVMVVVAEPQTRINVVSEFFNIKPLKEIQNKINQHKKYNNTNAGGKSEALDITMHGVYDIILVFW